MAVSIERGGMDDVGSLRELWLQLHHHHQEIGPQSGTFTDDETSWKVRASNYRGWLAAEGSFVLLARDGEELVGYALVAVSPGSDEDRDAWVVPDRVAELETMVVSDGRRGEGIGQRLLDEVDAELERIGVTELVVGLIPGNDGAQRLYERHGFRQRWLKLVKTAPG
jgi:ribosomal protein S18 acetylase RimI-like enzyme